jgi:hypothetical protein
MQKSYNDVADEYDQFKQLNPATSLDITSFAKAMDEQDGAPLRQQAYSSPWYKKANAAVDRVFNYSPDHSVIASPADVGGALGQFLGSGADSLLGTHVASTVENVGRDLPRTIAESLATVPEAASGAGLPAAIATWVNRGRKIAGYGDATLRGYAQTDSPVGGAISAASLGAANKLIPMAGQAGASSLREFLGRGASDLAEGALPETASAAESYLPPLAGLGAEVGTATGINEATRQAQMSVGPNAVGPLDPSRNPLTQENIAQNIAGAGMFLPQAIEGLRNPQRLSSKQVGQLDSQLQARDAAEQPFIDSAALKTPEQTQMELDGTDEPARQEAFLTTIKAHLDAADLLERDGNIDEANAARTAAVQALNEGASRKMSIPPELAQKLVETTDNQARMSTDARPEWLADFTDQVKGILDTMNEGRVNYEEEAAQKREELSPKDFAKWDADQKQNIGDSWHPDARDPAVVDRVWSSGKLQPLTPEWLASEFNATVDAGGNPQFATRVVAQKVANYMADRLPQAIESDVATRKAVTTPSKNVQAADARELEFVKAVNQLPPQFQRAVWQRTLEIKQHGNYTPSQAEGLGVSEGVRMWKGQQKTPYPNWQRAVIDAAYAQPTYGPNGERTNFTKLVAKSPDGKYLWQPPLASLLKGEGAKSQYKGGEANIEAIASKQGQENVGGAMDEEAVKADLAEGGTGEFVARTASDALRPGEDATPADQKLGIVDEKTLGKERDASAEVAKKGELIKKNMASLTDQQLWSLARDQFRLGHGLKEETKVAGIRAALNSVLEGKFRDVRRFFQFETPTQGERTDKSTSDYHVDRAAKVLAKLADSKAVERVKTGMRAQTGTGETSLAGTRENPSAPGQFVQDVSRTVRARIDSLLARQGYSGTMRDFLTEAATAIAMQHPAKALDFYRLLGHDEGRVALRDGKMDLGLNVDKPVEPGAERKAALALLQTLQHEMTHMDGYIKDGLLAKPDAYSDERKRVYTNMTNLMESLNDDERAAFLQQIREYVPESMQSKLRDKDGRPYGTGSPEEAVSEITSHVVNMLMFDTPQGRATANEMLDYAPQELREFARNTFKTIGDIMGAMKEAVQDPQVRADEGKPALATANTDPFLLTNSFDAMVRSAQVLTKLRYVDKAMADARAFISQANGAPQPGMTSAMWDTKATSPFKSQESMPEKTSDTAIEALQHAADYIGPREYDKSQRLGIVQRFLAPFRHQMWSMERNGNQLARPIADAIFSVENASNRLYSTIVQGFMKKNVDGSMEYDQKNPLVARIQQEKTGAWRDLGVNRVRAWQQGVHEMANGQKLDAQSMFVQDPKTGQVMVNPQVKDAQTGWDKIRSQLSKEDQDLVMNASVAMDKMGQTQKGIILAHLAESNANKATALLMAMNRQMTVGQGLQLGKAARDAFANNNPLALSQLVPPDQVQSLQRLFLGPDGKSGLLGMENQVAQHFDNRPGYSSESLPHDWVVRYKNPAGQTKFDSRPTELQVNTLATRLKSEGNRIDGEIVNRRDVNSITKTDDPDGILTKVSEQENYVWDNFLKDIEAKYGSQVVNDMRSGYTPVESAIANQGMTGMQKFLKERGNFVNRDKFDYIDAAITSAQRLAYTVAIRSMKGTVDLHLNDPSVRLLPSFRDLVNGHVTEMLRPQSETMKEMKGLVSGFFIGANLGSAVTNSVQSLQTLLPVLDQMNKTGGFVKPWLQLGRATADATDMSLSNKWTETAAQAARKDPATWSEAETVAALWKRQVESGGFSHAVIDDLVYGGDQQALTNARFGRGDYGPVTKASVVQSGLAMLNRFAIKPFQWVEHGNAKVSFLAGVRQAYQQGMRGDAVYSHANQVQGLATFSGGRANATGLQDMLSRGFTPGGAGLALSLQQYGFGVIAMHAQMIKDALGKSSTLTPGEVLRAKRVYGSALMTQVALAGTLGLPLVGATLTALEKIFNIPANQAVRNGLASLSTGPDGEPDDMGKLYAEVGLNGFLDYYTGLDASSRLGTSTLLGTSSYRGFSWGDLMGPVAGIIESGVKSLNYFATNQPMMAAHELAPAALKNSILMSDMQTKYGDAGIHDASGNLIYTPTPTESNLYRLGIRPREMARKGQAADAIRTSNDITSFNNDKTLDRASYSLLAGDPEPARNLAFSRMAADPTQSYKDVLRQVMDRAAGSQVEQDLLATGPKQNEADRAHIIKTFGADVNNRRSEVDLQQLRTQLASTLGDPSIAPNESSFKQAAMIDALVQGQGMPRSQAVRLVQFLHLE